MTRLEKTFDTLQAAGRKALIIYITAGMPEAAGTIEAVRRAEENGADLIELGLPFSDPMADGPVIQTASVRALQHGMTLPGVLDIVREIRKFSQIPLVGMGYMNQIFHYGVERFVQDAKAAGMDGLIVPDVPHEESGELRQQAAAAGFHLMEFITPGTTGRRMEETCAEASGFIYCVSNYGVTGVKEIDYSIIGGVCAEARRHTQVPLAIGFGIGTPAAAVAAGGQADGVIVGSAVVERLLADDEDGAMALIHAMRAALDKAYHK